MLQRNENQYVKGKSKQGEQLMPAEPARYHIHLLNSMRTARESKRAWCQQNLAFEFYFLYVYGFSCASPSIFFSLLLKSKPFIILSLQVKCCAIINERPRCWRILVLWWFSGRGSLPNKQNPNNWLSCILQASVTVVPQPMIQGKFLSSTYFLFHPYFKSFCSFFLFYIARMISIIFSLYLFLFSSYFCPFFTLVHPSFKLTNIITRDSSKL